MNPIRQRPRRLLPLALVAATALVLGACGDDDEETESTTAPTTAAADEGTPTTAAPPPTAATTQPDATDAPATEAPSTEAPTTEAPSTEAPSTEPGGSAPSGETAAERYTTDLTGVCPETVVAQTNWWPEPDHALFYQLIGADGEVDTDTNSYSGPLGSTGVNLEIRAGGPALGFQQVTSLMYQDDDILFGLVGTDEQIGNSAEAHVVSVLAWYQLSPQVFLWGNPEWDFETIADIGESDATVLAFEGSTYLDVFVGQGWLRREQIDTSYQGGPARFIAEDGAIVQQGFVTAEPYALENETPEWNKPVKFLLVAHEYPVYQNTVTVRADRVESEADCLEALVPLLQQASIDYENDPTVVNDVLVDFVSQIDGGGFTLTEGGVADAAEKQVDLGIVGNGPDGVFGSFEEDKLQRSIDLLVPVLEEQGEELKADLTPADLYTHEFLDESLAL